MTVAQVMDPTDVWMADLTGKPDFLLEAVDEILVPGQVGADELQGHFLIEGGIERLVDDAHPTDFGFFEDGEALGQEGARWKVKRGIFEDGKVPGDGRDAGEVDRAAACRTARCPELKRRGALGAFHRFALPGKYIAAAGSAPLTVCLALPIAVSGRQVPEENVALL